MMKPSKMRASGGVFLTLVSTVAFLAAIVAHVVAQQCYPSSILAPELKNHAADANGIVHVTYSFNDPNLSQSSKAAIVNAIAQWNNLSNSTKVVIEPAAPGDSSNLEFKGSENASDTQGCAAYRPVTGRVYFSPEWEQRAQDSTAAGATVMAHELGHYLGLDEGGTNPANRQS